MYEAVPPRANFIVVRRHAFALTEQLDSRPHSSHYPRVAVLSSDTLVPYLVALLVLLGRYADHDHILCTSNNYRESMCPGWTTLEANDPDVMMDDR